MFVLIENQDGMWAVLEVNTSTYPMTGRVVTDWTSRKTAELARHERILEFHKEKELLQSKGPTKC